MTLPQNWVKWNHHADQGVSYVCCFLPCHSSLGPGPLHCLLHLFAEWQPAADSAPSDGLLGPLGLPLWAAGGLHGGSDHRGWVALLLGLYAGCALLTWDGLYCLLPCLSMACTTLALWTHNMPRTRLLFLLNSPPLLAYNLITGAYSCALVEVCALISFAVAIYRFDLRGKKARLPQR